MKASRKIFQVYFIIMETIFILCKRKNNNNRDDSRSKLKITIIQYKRFVRQIMMNLNLDVFIQFSVKTHCIFKRLYYFKLFTLHQLLVTNVLHTMKMLSQEVQTRRAHQENTKTVSFSRESVYLRVFCMCD